MSRLLFAVHVRARRPFACACGNGFEPGGWGLACSPWGVGDPRRGWGKRTWGSNFCLLLWAAGTSGSWNA
jgi:hypothetical protein